MLFRKICTTSLMLWVLWGLAEPLFRQGGYEKCGRVARVAQESLAHGAIQALLAGVLAFNLVPLGGGGK